MTKLKSLFVLLLFPSAMTTIALAQVYEVPPSTTTRTHVPVISDYAMEQCVKLYNEAKWLNQSIERMYVDQYSQSSVNSYNSAVERHSRMISQFNQECAGKQSKSAYEAAQKLNQQ